MRLKAILQLGVTEMAMRECSSHPSAHVRGLLGLCLLGWALASPAAGISATNKYAWAENAGWLNFNAANGNVQVYTDHLEGFVWAENFGWIRLGSHIGGGAYTYANNSNTTYGVNHDGNGHLSGYAWSENAGWINFQTSQSQVTIDANGIFDGYAWGENVGYIHFRNTSPAYQVAVNRNPQAITNFNPPTTGVVSGLATLSATGGGSGNPVVFGATTLAICTVNIATVSYDTVGTCTVTADQAGNSLYLPAAQVTGNILVNLASLHDVAWSGNQFVVVGEGGVIRTSSDGAGWTSQTSLPLNSNTLNGVAWSGQLFVAVGDSGAILISPTDGLWINLNVGGNPLYDVTWGGGRFVAVGYNGTIFTSTEGIAWESSGVVSPSLNGVTWGGSRFVAVGDAGTILTSANGLFWSSVASSPTTEHLLDIAWSGTRFVAVGTGGTILTSSDGAAWTAQTIGSAHLYGVAWTGRQFRAVGAAGTVLTSTDGGSWTSATSGSVDWHGVAWSGDRLVLVGASDMVLSSLSAWGEYSPLNPTFWGLVGLPAQPLTSTIAGVFGDDGLGTYGTDWRVYQRNDVTYVDTFMADSNSPLAQGVGYWIKHKNAGVKNLSLANAQATATPLVTTNPRCPSTVGCYEITLKAFSDRVRYNQISSPLPYPVVWGDVRIEVNDGANTVAYVPSAATTYVNNQYWAWKNTANTNNYATFDDSTPGKIGVLQPWQGIQVEVKPASYGKTVKLLIPALPKTSQTPLPTDPVANRDRSPSPSLWSRLLDGLIASATAAELDGASAQTLSQRGREAIGEREREIRRATNGQDLQTGRAWSVRLRVEETGAKPGNAELVFGQLADAQVGYDRYDLPDLPPEQGPPDLVTDDPTPSLNVVFPHPDWGIHAGDYTSDYRPTDRGSPAASWRLEIRTDEPGRTVRLRWEGPSTVLSRSTVLDEDTSARYSASDSRFLQDGVSVTLYRTVSHFTWRYTGQPNR